MGGALVQAAALALLHFLWEGAAVGLVAALALRRTDSAAQRHLICVTALGACLLAPLITAAVLLLPALSSTPSADCPDCAPAAPAVLVHLPAVASHAVALLGPGALRVTVQLWLAGVLALTAYQLTLWLGVQRLRRGAFELHREVLALSAQRLLSRWRACSQVLVLASEAIVSPIVVGVWRPVIIFPAALLARMPVADFERLLLHEIAHIVRRDPWVCVLQVAVETLLFYHPVVHWLSRRARLERECACDDFAVRATGSAYEYARLLTSLTVQPMPLTLGVAGGELLARLRHLAGERVHPEGLPERQGQLLLVALMAALLVLHLPAPPLQAPLAPIPEGFVPMPSPVLARTPPQEPVEHARVFPAPWESATPRDLQSKEGSGVQRTPFSSATGTSAGRSVGGMEAHPVHAGSADISPQGPVQATAMRGGAPTSQDVAPLPEPSSALPPPPAPPPAVLPSEGPAPEYPLQARLAGIQGTVLVLVRIAADGHTEGLSILKASPQGVFEGAVRRALMRWHYPVHDGQPHEASYQLSFTLAGVSSQPASLCTTATASRTCETP